MPKITIPDRATKKWSVTPSGELAGVIWASKNIDLRSNTGKVRLADRAKVLYDNSDDSDANDTPKEFKRTNADGTDRWWAMIRSTDNGTPGMWSNGSSSPTDTWAQDTLLNSPSTCKDSMETFLRTASGYDRLVVPSGTNLSMLNFDEARTLNIVSSTNAAPIAITTTTHGLFTGDRVTISGHTVNTAANGTWTIIKTGATTFTLTGSTGNGIGGADGTIVTGKWIRTWWTNTLGQVALDSNYPTVVRRFNKILLVGNSNFVHVITPFSDGTITGSANVAYKRLVFPAGYEVSWIVVTPSKAWIGLSNTVGGDAIASAWDGGEETYEDPAKLFDRWTLAGEEIDGVIFTVNGKGQLLRYNGAAFAQVAAFPVFYSKNRWGTNVFATRPTCLHRNGMRKIDGRIHMLISAGVDAISTEMLENMTSGIYVYDEELGLYNRYTLGQYRATNNDWGSRTIDVPGALVETDIASGHFLAGAKIFTDNATTALYGIFYADITGANGRGYFVTSQIQGGDASAFWGDLVARFKKLENSTDAIIVKARTEISPTLTFKRAAITWTSTTTFTSTDADFQYVTGGEEIEIYVGKGAGATAHVSTISLLTGTYTVTLDEAIPNVSGTAQVFINNFQKIGSITDQSVLDRVLQIFRDSPWVQLKVELRGTVSSPEIDELQLTFKTISI